MSRRLCVFCGEKPPLKNKEHILPMWLLDLTGDPNRVVNFGVNFENGEIIEFAWDQLVVPACKSCNSYYGEALEGKLKPIIEALLNREEICVSEHLLLLDWLDKVRVGLWLNYQLLQNFPLGIMPNFRINDRIGKKDRMVAIYTIDSDEIGLNAFGVETPLFHLSPSCFGLKINNILLFNMSTDFLFSGNCGFPFPEERRLLLDGENNGKLELSNFSTSHQIKNKLIKQPIIKPTMHLYQPIMQKDTSGHYPGGFLGAEWLFDSYIAEHTFDQDSGKGVLFQQFDDRVEVLNDPNQLVDFDNVTGDDCAPLGSIIAQIYDHQIFIQNLHSFKASDKQMKHHRELEGRNIEIADEYRKMANNS